MDERLREVEGIAGAFAARLQANGTFSVARRHAAMIVALRAWGALAR